MSRDAQANEPPALRHRMSVFVDAENVARVYIPIVVESLAGWDLHMRGYAVDVASYEEVLRCNGIVPIKVPRSGRGAADSLITIELVEELCLGRSTAFCLVSGDAGFAVLVNKITSTHGLPVWVFGPTQTPDVLRNAATRFYLLDDSRLTTSSISRKLRSYIDEFLDTSQIKTVDAFSTFLKMREPSFSPRQYGARSITDMLKKICLCRLLPIRNRRGVVQTYELLVT